MTTIQSMNTDTYHERNLPPCILKKKLEPTVLTTPRRRFKGVAVASSNSLPVSPFVIPSLNLSSLQPVPPKPKTSHGVPHPPSSPFTFQSPSEIPLSPLTRRSQQNYSYRQVQFAAEEPTSFSTQATAPHDDESDCQEAVNVITNWKNSSLQYISQTPRSSSISTSIFSSPNQYIKPLDTPKSQQTQNNLDALLQFSARSQNSAISGGFTSPFKSPGKQLEESAIPETKADKLNYFSKILDSIIADSAVEISLHSPTNKDTIALKEIRKTWNDTTPLRNRKAVAQMTSLENDLKQEMVNQFLSAPNSVRSHIVNHDATLNDTTNTSSLLDTSTFETESYREQFAQDSKEVLQLITQYIKGEPEKTDKDALPQIQKQSFRKKQQNTQTLSANFPSSTMARQIDTRFAKYLQDPEFFDMFSKYIKLFSHDEPPTEDEIKHATQHRGPPKRTDILKRNQENVSRYSPESYKQMRSKQIEDMKNRLYEAKQKHTSSWRNKLMEQEMKITKKIQKVEQFLLQKQFKKNNDIDKSKALWISSMFGLYAFANMEKALLVQSNERTPLVYSHY